jgi:hypothetical protein
LSHLGQQGLLFGGLGPGEKQQARLLGPLGGTLFAPIAEIAESNAALGPFPQGQDRGAVIPVAGCQHQIEDASIDGAQYRQLKAKEPAPGWSCQTTRLLAAAGARAEAAQDDKPEEVGRPSNKTQHCPLAVAWWPAKARRSRQSTPADAPSMADQNTGAEK